MMMYWKDQPQSEANSAIYRLLNTTLETTTTENTKFITKKIWKNMS